MIILDSVLRVLFAMLTLLSFTTWRDLKTGKNCSDCSKDAIKTMALFTTGVVFPKTILVGFSLLLLMITLLNKISKKRK